MVKPVPIIGVDLDNTIVSYDENMHKIALEIGLINKDVPKNKTAIREHIRANPNGEMDWQRLQAIVYGSRMSEAKLVDGAAEFFILCKKHSIPVYIISHKTEYSNYRVGKSGKTGKSEKIDAETKKAIKVNLRKAALGWMRKKGFFNKLGLSQKQVCFLSTRKEKIIKIREFGCTHFIDDLDEVFKEPEFPRSIVKILYMNKTELDDVLVCESWSEINSYFFGEEKIRQVFSDLLCEKVVSLEQIGGGRNSRVFRLSTKEKKEKVFLAKQYFKQLNDPRDRLETEFSSLEFLKKNKLDCVPKPIIKDSRNNCAIYEYVNGEKITKPAKNDIIAATDFVAKLKQLASAKPRPIFNPASDACFSFQDIINIIERRLGRLSSLSSAQKTSNKKNDEVFEEMHIFLEESFKPAYASILEWTKQEAKAAGIDFAEELDSELQTLSPSDFGFHNALKKPDGSLVFLDFEYFGYDSPMKLISDFLLHDNMKLSQEQRQQFFSLACSIFRQDPIRQDPLIVERVRIAYPLFGLVWCLIFLNEFLHQDILRREFARGNANNSENKYRNENIYNINKIRFINRSKQLRKSKMLLRQIIKTYHDFTFKAG